ncbi:protein of unknown function [Xenorhabdus poinarii G6]|uniref:Uncharacterized protein n=1 Tax=Xenorhabdus poinarii G6 TaxID=1354304 RepID=A0A068R6J7_9GAMM|nr:protein of unknown function [Xenorhabdus poinarii G6]
MTQDPNELHQLAQGFHANLVKECEKNHALMQHIQELEATPETVGGNPPSDLSTARFSIVQRTVHHITIVGRGSIFARR